MSAFRIILGLVFLTALFFGIIVFGIYVIPGSDLSRIIWVFILAFASANGAGLASLVLALTRFRWTRTAYVCAALSFDLGVILSLIFSRARVGNLTWQLPLLSWLPMLLGAAGLLRWAISRTPPKGKD
jgi:hypothetical protein